MAGDVCRFAPSATGRAHPGTVLAALLCWLDARKRGARVVLRLEDLDPERCTPALVVGLQQDLAWFGLDWDLVEIQSEHAARHHAALDHLAERGVLYPCPLSRSELKAIGRLGPDGAWTTDNRNRGRPLPPGGWRACADPLRARLPGNLADPVVRRRDGAIAYQLAVVVDDAAVGVTRIVRGRDLAASTATQVALQELLGVATPTYLHHALLLEADRSGKLSKFHGAVAVPELRSQLSAEVLCGVLAAAVGLIPNAVPVSPQELIADFSWDVVRRDDVPVRWTGSTLDIISAEVPRRAGPTSDSTYAWLTPAAPAAIAIAVMPPLAKAFDRPLPPVDHARFMRLLHPDGSTVDELVVDRVSQQRLHLMTHGGPGVRQAVDACMAAHGLALGDVDLDSHCRSSAFDVRRSALMKIEVCDSAGRTEVVSRTTPENTASFTPNAERRTPNCVFEVDSQWSALARAPSPAAVAWLLAHPNSPPPFAADFLRRCPVILITGPANAGKSTLLNHWCGRRRALVSDIPGTTRDLIAAETLIDGWRVRLLDSAGLRPTDDPLEQAGQALVAAARQRADLVLSLRPPGDDAPEISTDLVIYGKADLRPADALNTGEALTWSANDAAAGLARLGRAVLQRLGLPAGPTG